MTRSSKTRQKNSPPSRNNTYYPVFLNLSRKKCLIVGGGRVAERKCSSLIKAGADVTVVSPEITSRLVKHSGTGTIRHVRRRYRSSDMTGAFLIIAATDSAETNRKVYADAIRRNKPVNVVDQPALSSFVVPSLVKRGDLTLAISTSGASPAFAKAIRKELQNIFGPEFAVYLNRVRRIRARAIRDIPDKKARARLLKKIISSSEISKLFRS